MHIVMPVTMYANARPQLLPAHHLSLAIVVMAFVSVERPVLA